ncbi:hypothetical protein [Embleya sp. NBC_00896]|uniref:hypothetical protein n=1 Tax=Embleya sp. NBC_00896 TaxID=2975961 RepID=UPI002F917FCC|nr:hypothetical protein OG928_43445 [Embleya sp. NBC_00896]
MASSVEQLRVALEREAEELAVRREELETELAEVERQLEARRNAVAHLALIRPLVPRPRQEVVPATPADTVPGDSKVPDRAERSESTGGGTRPPKAATRKRAARAQATSAPARKATRVVTTAPVPAKPRPVRTRLRDEIATLLAATGQPMNARQLTEALGENPTKSRLESVRTSAEGLIKAGRAAKAGRGLFTTT